MKLLGIPCNGIDANGSICTVSVKVNNCSRFNPRESCIYLSCCRTIAYMWVIHVCLYSMRLIIDSICMCSNAWFNSTCNHAPPGHTPGDLQFCSHLAVYSPPPGTQKETIPHPRDSSSTTNTLFCVQSIDFRTTAKPDVLIRT